MKNITFIPKKVVLLLHEELIGRYRGCSGVRDIKLPDSALAQPKATFGDNYLHDDIFKMAGAYGYQLCNNPFVDGNKRIALVAMDIFLQKNGYEIIAPEKETYSTIIKLSSSQLDKESLTKWLVDNTAPND